MKPRMNNFVILMIVVLALMIIFIQREQGAKEERKNNFLNLVKLPAAKKRGDISLEEAICKRRSVREFKVTKLNKEQISQILWAAQGITDKEKELRAAPSAGGVYPLEIYAIYEDGVFRYIPQTHQLERINPEDVRSRLGEVANDQESIISAPFIIVIAASYEKTTEQFEDKGVRFVDIEAGHVAENIQLQAVALGLGSVPIGSFSEKDVKSVLSLSAQFKPLYIIPIGYPR